MSSYRSGLEHSVADALRAALHEEPMYERYRISYVIPARTARYTPDFVLPNGIIIETKGRFIADDRQKHILIKEQYPSLDIRFVFSNSRNRLYKGSKTTYADWCSKHGFMFADKTVPLAWIREKSKWNAYYAILTLLDKDKKKGG